MSAEDMLQVVLDKLETINERRKESPDMLDLRNQVLKLAVDLAGYHADTVERMERIESRVDMLEDEGEKGAA